MALHRCPECRKRISDSIESCPHCGFSFKEADLEIYRQKLEQRRLHNQEVNRKSVKLQLIWLGIFTVVIGVATIIAN
ncbi:zinc ribbon domain-containing protein [Mannheimia indoligenes]|uniref:zinc ribbon domain-containing protein n=1 Tax=Mannheimia indoligenes TaxID=3103145 RepID=UPI002FE5836E